MRAVTTQDIVMSGVLSNQLIQAIAKGRLD